MGFRKATVTALLTDVLRTRLNGVVYHAEGINVLAKQVSDEIKERLRELTTREEETAPAEQGGGGGGTGGGGGGLDSRYKLVAQVFLLEQRGQGVRLGHRCLWDPDCDAYATASYQNEHIFAVATAYGIYMY